MKLHLLEQIFVKISSIHLLESSISQSYAWGMQSHINKKSASKEKF